MTYDFDPEDLAECEDIAAELGVPVEWVADRWERHSEEHFAGWLYGLDALDAATFMEITNKSLDNPLAL